MPEKFALQLGCVKVINDQVGTVVGERLKRTPEEAFVEWCFAVQMYGTGGCCIKERKKEWTNLQPANRLQQNYKTLYKCLLEDSVGLIRQPGRRKVEQLARQTFTFSYGPLGKVVTPKTLGIFGTVPVCDRSAITRSTLTCSILPHDSLLYSMTTLPKGFSKI
ncbi:RING finger protein [Trichinella spiralis]|uniref:RING finger protein n=1 Tax=Trichinella spiralis TaxID=6334 RepID=A0ABR3L208_TRISP